MSAIHQRFLEQWPVDQWRTHRIVIACSGGPDSTALARLLHLSHPRSERLILAHFHHNLRGPSADADADFVEQLAKAHGMQFELGHAGPGEVLNQATGEGVESAARQLRYDYLCQTAHRLGARYLVTGHTADDQAETVLYQLLRGSGLAGIAGIPKHRIASEALTIVRPMLAIGRTEIVDWLAELGQDACTDAHNLDHRFQRNRIRLELIPWLEENIHPTVRQSLLSLAQIGSDAQDLIRQQANELADRVTTSRSDQVIVLNLPELRSAHVHLQRELFVVTWQRQSWPLQAMTLAHWQRLALSLKDAHAASFDLPAGIRAEFGQCELTLSRSLRSHSPPAANRNLKQDS